MTRLLDTDILVDLLRGKPNATAWFVGLSERPTVSGFAALELLQGCQNSVERDKVDKLLLPLTVVWPSIVDMEAAYTQYHGSVLSSGPGLLDCLIAYTAIGRGETLCTFNIKHYRVVAALTTEQPYKHS